MAQSLANAYVQILPTAKGMKNALKGILNENMPSGSEPGNKYGNGLASKIKGVIAAAGIGKALSSAITEGANLEQSLGGIETLFKESADKVKQNAANAYKTAGMSANEYMELTTSFSASLLSSLANDTSKSADIADMAMTDMSDNANKMGTSMEDIKNAYQGFAKQNYTMLDNLKLGYGGTKTEMQRLLADAQKITGVKYDINNLADVYSAIHVIQGELGITGTTAKEAATTISGSFSSMKAAFKNVIGELTLGKDIGPSMQALGDTVITFFAGNLIPAVGNILSGIPDLINGMVTVAIRNINIASNHADAIISQGAQIIGKLVTGLIVNLPYITEGALKLVTSFGSALLNADWGGITNETIGNIRNGLELAAGEIFGSDDGILSALKTAIQTRLPEMLQNGVEIVTNIANGILQNMPTIITMAGTMITNFIDGIVPAIPMVLQAGADLILNLVNGIISNLPQIALSAANAIFKFSATIGQNLPTILQSGIEIIGKLAAGLIQAIPMLVSKIPQIITSIKNAFLNTDWWSIGTNIIKGIAKGLASAGGQLWDAVKGVLGSFKDKVLGFFGIHSPSTWGVFVGEMIDGGVAKGLIRNAKSILNASKVAVNAISEPFDSFDKYNAVGEISRNIKYESRTTYTPKKREEEYESKAFEKIIKAIESMNSRDAYFYIDGKLIAKAITEPVSETIDKNKKFESMLKGAWA